VVNLTRNQVKYRRRIQATQYAREGLEITYNIAVNTATEDWDSLIYVLGNDSGLARRPTQDLNDNYAGFTDGEEPGLGGIFTRGLYFAHSDDTLKVTSRVSWQESGKNQEIELLTNLINFGEPVD